MIIFVTYETKISTESNQCGSLGYLELREDGRGQIRLRHQPGKQTKTM
jgi:hypothetical protein